MPRLSPVDQARRTRRGFLRNAALASVSAGAAGSFAADRADAAPAPIRMTDGGPGTAGAIWRPLLEGGRYRLPDGLKIEWVNGTPGQVQLQLATGAANVSVFGALGVAELAPRGSDIVIFGPALNNHGRWIVRGDSPYRSPRDLVGKTIATQLEGSDTYRHARLAALLHGIDLKRDVRVVFGPPTANVALFERGDVDAVIAIEPTATRLVARGAREIARVGDMWRDATGDTAPLFLIGSAAHREWAEQNRNVTTAIAEIFVDMHRKLRAEPQRLAELHKEFGIPTSERAAIELLPKRLIDIYSTQWDSAVFANIDRQIDAGIKAGILAKRPDKPVYDSRITVAG
jgi:NitT/TauT family transport system substrate-binding protein